MRLRDRTAPLRRFGSKSNGLLNSDISLLMFADPWNPSATEVRVWAYTDGAVAPCEDWSLSLAWARHERDYLEFAGDANCPNREFFLHLLYFIVGRAVRNGHRCVSESEPVIRGFVDLAADSNHLPIKLWRERALHLLRHPSEFEYAAWCEGDLVRTGERHARLR